MEKCSNILSFLTLILINIVFWNWLSIAIEPIELSLDCNYEILSSFGQIAVKVLNIILMYFILIGFAIIGSLSECVVFKLFKELYNIILDTYISENYKLELKNEE